MATSQAVSSCTAAAVGSTASAITETITGLHVLKIDGFSAIKDLGVGKSIKSSTFHALGHSWYIQCYPCGFDEESAGWVSVFLCLSVHNEQVEAGLRCELSVTDGDGGLPMFVDQDIDCKHTYKADTLGRWGFTDFIEWAELESRLKDDCFRIRCDVYMVKDEFPAVLQPDLHRSLSEILASGMPGDLTTFRAGGELFTLHRGLPGPSAQLAASTTSGAGVSTVARKLPWERGRDAGSHVLTIDGYSQANKVLLPRESLDSIYFHVGGHTWMIQVYPSSEKVKDTDCLAIFLVNVHGPAVKVRFKLTLLTLAREIISSFQSCYAFARGDCRCRCYFPFNTEPGSSPLLADRFHVKCDVTVVKEITPLRPPDLHRHFRDLLASQVGTDVEFEVGGDLFSAHKCVLATRSTAFMADFFGPAGTGSRTTVTRVHINDMEPRVFKALLHFIYTDTLPEVPEDDMVGMAQGLLVAADRYAMERLKLICGDMLCNYMNDARTAVDTLELAVKHGCHRLKEKCKELIKGHLAKVVP